jgi:hypothetical protein
MKNGTWGERKKKLDQYARADTSETEKLASVKRIVADHSNKIKNITLYKFSRQHNAPG